MCAGDFYVLDKKFVNLRDRLFTYKYESVSNYATRQEGLWRTEGTSIASLILNLET